MHSLKSVTACPETDKMDPDEPEEVLLDTNMEAEKYSFYILGSFEVSPDHSMLAYAEDVTGATSSQCNPALRTDRGQISWESRTPAAHAGLVLLEGLSLAVFALQGTRSTHCL